jgi:hypothetical protein
MPPVATIKAAGRDAVAIQDDVTVPADVYAVADEVAPRWGGIDGEPTGDEAGGQCLLNPQAGSPSTGHG